MENLFEVSVIESRMIDGHVELDDQINFLVRARSEEDAANILSAEECFDYSSCSTVKFARVYGIDTVLDSELCEERSFKVVCEKVTSNDSGSVLMEPFVAIVFCGNLETAVAMVKAELAKYDDVNFISVEEVEYTYYLGD